MGVGGWVGVCVRVRVCVCVGAAYLEIPLEELPAIILGLDSRRAPTAEELEIPQVLKYSCVCVCVCVFVCVYICIYIYIYIYI